MTSRIALTWPAIAREIAGQVVIGNRIYPMSNLTKLPEQDQASVLDEYDGLAEIYPEHKYRNSSSSSIRHRVCSKNKLFLFTERLIDNSFSSNIELFPQRDLFVSDDLSMSTHYTSRTKCFY